ncbi:CPBP family intramembrane metalloprotease [Emticicia sp. CRIBPO]|uniref:CPBP family glutamic-type intramembrane protease n=1 Tax=Emticicia sp. CRIBPO TaxID=2683258 RepID=UPI001411FCFC|nr:CPBP family glutamic-type intramembrane protease [Emticicia sp. CRIBPO]NBA86608.1 CPBP family intramembrane metalloprotease [Emticicia sp. CRIBPO]
MIKEIFQDIRIILLKGDIEGNQESFKLKLKKTMLILVVSFLVAMFLMLFIHLSLLKMNISIENQVDKFISLRGIVLSAFFFILVGPIMEEFVFRASLRYSCSNMVLMGVGISYFGVRNHDFASCFPWMNNTIFMIIVILSFSLFIFLLLKCFKNISSRLSVFWLRNPKLIFYLSVIVFGFIHFLNFRLGVKYLFLMPLLTLPQTMYGIVLGYSRMKFGIQYSIFLHVATNLLFFSPRLLTYVI